MHLDILQKIRISDKTPMKTENTDFILFFCNPIRLNHIFLIVCIPFYNIWPGMWLILFDVIDTRKVMIMEYSSAGVWEEIETSARKTALLRVERMAPSVSPKDLVWRKDSKRTGWQWRETEQGLNVDCNLLRYRVLSFFFFAHLILQYLHRQPAWTGNQATGGVYQ